MLKSLFDFSQSNFVWDLSKTLVSYYGLKEYLHIRFYDEFRQERIKKIVSYGKNPSVPGEIVFWQKVFTGGILEGDIVQLQSFQISPWFPRKPGLYWTYEAAKARRIAREQHIERFEKDLMVFDIYGKTLMSELGGLGSLNFRKDRDNVLITATASGNTDRGIPIICTPAVWEQIKTEFKRERMLEVDLQGVVEPIPGEFDSFFTRSPGLPKIAIHVKSLLNIKFMASNLKINVTPWALFERDDRYAPFGFTYITHNLFSDRLGDSLDWMRNYIEQHDGKVTLTDFDEETNSLNARFPISRCADGSIVSNEIIEYCQNLSDRVRRVQ